MVDLGLGSGSAFLDFLCPFFALRTATGYPWPGQACGSRRDISYCQQEAEMCGKVPQIEASDFGWP